MEWAESPRPWEEPMRGGKKQEIRKQARPHGRRVRTIQNISSQEQCSQSPIPTTSLIYTNQRAHPQQRGCRFISILVVIEL